MSKKTTTIIIAGIVVIMITLVGVVSLMNYVSFYDKLEHGVTISDFSASEKEDIFELFKIDNIKQSKLDSLYFMKGFRDSDCRIVIRVPAELGSVFNKELRVNYETVTDSDYINVNPSGFSGINEVSAEDDSDFVFSSAYDAGRYKYHNVYKGEDSVFCFEYVGSDYIYCEFVCQYNGTIFDIVKNHID